MQPSLPILFPRGRIANFYRGSRVGFLLETAMVEQKIRNLCTACGFDFSSLSAFDRHRTGRHGVDRRCMTQAEMLADGMRHLENGRWAGEENPLFAKKDEGEE